MWFSSLWPSSVADDDDDRFSLQHFKYLINQLQGITVVDENNREMVIDILQSIVEIVSYGDKHDPMIFECFMESQVLAEFVRLLRISANSIIEASLLQYLSIMIQNMDSEPAIYYCLSNDYINSIISHQFEFDNGDLTSYYISFLRAVSSKITKDTLCLLVKVNRNAVVSFPLYNEAIKFANHGEKMIQTAVRALTLSIYHVSDDIVFQYFTSPPISKYFADLVHNVKEQCFHLNAVVHSREDSHIDEKRKELLSGAEKFTDELYYLKDILNVGESRLTTLVMKNLISLLILPLLLPSLQLRPNDGSNLSAVTSIYVLIQLLQVIGGKILINYVAQAVLYPYLPPSPRDTAKKDTEDGSGQASSFDYSVNEMERMVSNGSCNEFSNIDGNYLSGFLAKDTIPTESTGILGCILSNNHILVVASLYLLLTIAESKDLDSILAPAIKLIGKREITTMNTSDVQATNNNFFVRYMPQILNSLLKVLASQSPSSVLIKWQIGRLLHKLLSFQGERLSNHCLHLFNASCERSCKSLQEEVEGRWFDYIPETLINEWKRCRKELEESSQIKDPIFILDFAVGESCLDGKMTSYVSWHRMVDAVKLKAFVSNGNLIKNTFPDLMSSSASTSGRTHFSDPFSAGFGSDIALVSGFPCRIALPSAGVRDVYVIPVTRGFSGKLSLAEKHPFRNQRGIVIAAAPLAGLNPKIDEGHPTWLHLCIREFDPRFHANSSKIGELKKTNHSVDGRWTLGFPNEEACKVALKLILEEITKQKSYIESIIVPFPQDGILPDSEGNKL